MDLYWVSETDSTMNLARRLHGERGLSKAEETVVVMAEFQSQGRGRLGRRWEGTAGESLMCSVAVGSMSASAVASKGQLLPVCLALSVREAAEAAGGASVRLKWPNDVVVVDGDRWRKLGGVLGETHWSGDRPLVVVGVGVNLGPGAVPPDTAGVAWSQVCAAVPDRVDLVASIVGGFERRRSAPAAEVVREWASVCDTLGRRVAVQVGEKDTVEGRAEGLAPDGGLIVDTADGRRTVRLGDVTHLR